MSQCCYGLKIVFSSLSFFFFCWTKFHTSQRSAVNWALELAGTLVDNLPQWHQLLAFYVSARSWRQVGSLQTSFHDWGSGDSKGCVGAMSCVLAFGFSNFDKLPTKFVSFFFFFQRLAFSISLFLSLSPSLSLSDLFERLIRPCQRGQGRLDVWTILHVASTPLRINCEAALKYNKGK